MSFEPFWTDTRLERLKTMWADGKTGTEIGNDLGCSRNAVMGKLNRLGLFKNPQTPPRVTGSTVPKRKYTRRSSSPSMPKLGRGKVVLKPKPAVIKIVPHKPCGILDVTGCRWAIGEDASVIGRHVFCNAVTDEGQTYCSAHRAVNVASHSKQLIRETVRWALHSQRRRPAA